VSLQVQCDRCGTIVASGVLVEIGRREQLQGQQTMGGYTITYDLCPPCHNDLIEWMASRKKGGSTTPAE
jgi:hypothetical protein